MSKWTRTHTFVAGMVLILATNTVALLGVVYNRGEAESTLKLTERELHLPYGWGLDQENSGITLELKWRTLWRQSRIVILGAACWLDKTKLMALGFDVSIPEDTPHGRMYYDKLLPKEVLLVLEFDGSAYGSSLARMKRYMQEEEALLKSNPGKKEFVDRAKNAKQAFYQEQRINSRLFVIDAGLDAASLRARYSDRHRYAIVRGQIKPGLDEINHKPKLTAYIDGISISQINVPAVYRQIFEPLQQSARTNRYDAAVSPYKVTVAFGKRLEPWITEATGSK